MLRACLAEFLDVFPGFLSPGVLVFSILVVGIAGYLLFFGGLGLVMAIPALVCYWTAVAWMLAGEICGPARAMGEFTGVQWGAFLVFGFGPFALLMWLMMSA
jgi:hypothetical protein